MRLLRQVRQDLASSCGVPDDRSAMIGQPTTMERRPCWVAPSVHSHPTVTVDQNAKVVRACRYSWTLLRQLGVWRPQARRRRVRAQWAQRLWSLLPAERDGACRVQLDPVCQGGVAALQWDEGRPHELVVHFCPSLTRSRGIDPLWLTILQSESTPPPGAAMLA